MSILTELCPAIHNVDGSSSEKTSQILWVRISAAVSAIMEVRRVGASPRTGLPAAISQGATYCRGLKNDQDCGCICLIFENDIGGSVRQLYYSLFEDSASPSSPFGTNVLDQGVEGTLREISILRLGSELGHFGDYNHYQKPSIF